MGNSWTISSSASTSNTPGAHELFFVGPKLPSERAVQMEIYLWPTETGPIAPDQRWTVRDIPLPAPGQQRSLRRRGQVRGVPLELNAIYGAGAKRIGNLRFVTPDGSPRLTLIFPASMPEGTRGMVVSSTDDRGRPVTLELHASRNDGKQVLEVYAVKAQPGARRIHLVYASCDGASCRCECR
jgi:hypothetical protein